MKTIENKDINSYRCEILRISTIEWITQGHKALNYEEKKVTKFKARAEVPVLLFLVPQSIVRPLINSSFRIICKIRQWSYLPDRTTVRIDGDKACLTISMVLRT